MRGQPTVDGMVLATLPRRLFCWMLDRLLKLTLFVIVVAIAGIEVTESPWGPPELIAASVLLNTGYDFVFGIHGVSPGGYLLRLRLVHVDGREPGVRRSLARAVAALVNEVFVFAGSLAALFDRRRQTVHDKIAGTIVIMLPPEPDQRA